MILTKYLTININTGNISFYRKNNPNIKIGDSLEIKISDLSHGSNYLVDIVCDNCEKKMNIPYSRYFKKVSDNNHYFCRKCSYIRRNHTNIERYGVDNPFKSEKIKEKIKKTNLKKYGVDNPFKSEKIKEKIKKTNLKKYGCESFTQTDDYNKKTKETCLNKYGVDHHTKSKEIKEKIKQTNLEKYGVDHFSKTTEFINSMEKTNLDKYGANYVTKLNKFKLKIKKNNLEKYGVENVFQLEEIKEKIKKTNLKKYGAENVYQSNIWRKDKFIISSDDNYVKYLGKYLSLFNCDNGFNHQFEISSSLYFSRKHSDNKLCLKCYPVKENRSIKEEEIFNFIKKIYNKEIIKSYRDKLEIDIYLPDLKLGFEFNGLYYHSINFKDKNYHLDKIDYFRKNGIRVIQIWEDDWIFRKDIIKSQINNLLKKSNKIFARKCKVKEIQDNKVIKKFLDNNHIQGWNRSNLKIGLFYKDELVSIMTFDHFEGRKKMNQNEWNLSRFCTLKYHTVVGGASKIFNFFLKNYNVERVITYASKDFSIGDVYEKIGFKCKHHLDPDYKYIIDNKRIHKSNFKNSITNISEKNLNLDKIYDSGKIKYEFLKNNI